MIERAEGGGGGGRGGGGVPETIYNKGDYVGWEEPSDGIGQIQASTQSRTPGWNGAAHKPLEARSK